MKKTLITLAALCVSCAVYAEGTGALDNPVTTVDWDLSAGPKAGTITYTATLTGNYRINLGAAAIVNGESFTLTVTTVTPSWGVNPYGVGLVSTSNPYTTTTGADQFGIYIGNPAGRNGDLVVEYYANKWTYNSTNTFSPNFDNVPATPSAETPITFGFSFEYLNAADATAAGIPGSNGNGINNGRLYFSSTADSDVTVTSKDEGNVYNTYNFSTLTNYGPASDNVTYGIDPNAVTTITITKKGTLPVPEPATATLSLLALAGLAARRRRM